MRYFEIAGGLRMNVSEEEWEFLLHGKNSIMRESDLDERHQEVARKMVSRGLLNIIHEDGETFYTPNSLQSLDEIWRI